MTDASMTAAQICAAAKERYHSDPEVHARVAMTIKVLQETGIIGHHPSDPFERQLEQVVVQAAAVACIIHGPGERKRMAVITPSDHYFRQWQRVHPEYEGVAITSVQKARGQLFDSYVCYDPALRMAPGEVGPRVMAVRSALKPR